MRHSQPGSAHHEHQLSHDSVSHGKMDCRGEPRAPRVAGMSCCVMMLRVRRLRAGAAGAGSPAAAGTAGTGPILGMASAR